MTTLIPLHSFDPSRLLKKYQSKDHVFPLILSVLEKKQEGIVYSDKNQINYFIIHKFGFADLIETEKNTEFDSYLYHFFLEKEFKTEKIRWYNVPEEWVSKFKKEKNNTIQLSTRIKLIRHSFDPAEKQDHHLDKTISVEKITESNYDAIDASFNISLGSQFWSSKNHFLDNAIGIVIYKNKIPATICYSCALVNSIAEVDILTKEEFRGLGLGKLAVAEFINTCNEKKIKPHWDCYTNNNPSFLLAKFFNFNPQHTYPHVIISK